MLQKEIKPLICPLIGSLFHKEKTAETNPEKSCIFTRFQESVNLNDGILQKWMYREICESSFSSNNEKDKFHRIN